jgi:peptidoglycan/xylan/chitin deacetylase (PgdA/CDA1 family)
MFLSLPLEHDGTVASRDYSLVNITKPGAREWRQPLVSLTFDDGWQATYNTALPALERHDYTATFYVNPATIETSGFMTAGELDNLEDSGNEIGANGYNHDDLTTLNTNTLAYQLREGRDYLRTAGFPVTDLATPFGRSDAEVSWYARQYYTTVRGTNQGVNTRQNLDPYNLKVLYVTPNTTPQTLDAMLQAAKQEDGWLILVYHRVTNAPSQPYGTTDVEHVSTTPAALQQQLSSIHASGIKVLPVAAAYAELEK